MSNVIIFSLISLISAGVLDVVYKHAAQKTQSRGVFFCVGGIVWLLFEIASTHFLGVKFEFDSITLIFGLIIGILATIANICLVEGLVHIDVSLGSTIYRLNTIGVVLLSYFFLDETMGPLKLLGICLGLASILVIYSGPSNNNKRYIKLFIIVLIFASLMRAIFGVVLKYALLLGVNPNIIMVFVSFSWMIGGLVYFMIRERGSSITGDKIKIGIFAGILIMIVANSLTKALEYGEASTVTSIANLSFIIALIISLASKMEKITRGKIFAIILASSSILTLAHVV